MDPNRKIVLAPVRYGAVQPQVGADPIVAVQTIISALVDENGVRLGLALTEPQAARLLNDLREFGWRFQQLRANDRLYNEPGLAIQVLAALLGPGTEAEVTQAEMDAVAGARLDYEMGDGHLKLQVVAREPGKPN